VRLGILFGLVILVTAAAVVAIEAHRIRAETTQLTTSLARLGRVRRALDAVRTEAAATRSATETTADVFAQRGHR
jgi:hypothetical protein